MQQLANFFGEALPAEQGAWRWEFPADSPTSVTSPSFAGRLDAQAWLGENLDKLRTASLAQVQLTHRGERVGKPIELV
ncbi:MAG TPA: hypothetical protein VK030_03145 [Actinomycetales bacterium]|nr:hypothetical protein [Actinomycetales bacterium]